MKRSLLIVVMAALMLLATITTAFAGEVKGPWEEDVYNTNTTGALDHAKSACAASGLNDNDPAEGQNDLRVQTAADSWKFYGLPKGAPGTLGLCRGGGPG